MLNVAALPGLRGNHSVLGGEVQRYTRPALRGHLERAGFSVKTIDIHERLNSADRGRACGSRSDCSVTASRRARSPSPPHRSTPRCPRSWPSKRRRSRSSTCHWAARCWRWPRDRTRTLRSVATRALHRDEAGSRVSGASGASGRRPDRCATPDGGDRQSLRDRPGEPACCFDRDHAPGSLEQCGRQSDFLGEIGRRRKPRDHRLSSDRHARRHGAESK